MITDNEKKIVNSFETVNDLLIEGQEKYSEEFYETMVCSFLTKPKKKKRLLFLFLKRAFDIVFSLFLILVTLIPFFVIFILIKCDSKGPAIFRNRRIGKKGKVFSCLKFRSMLTSAPPEIATSIGGVEQYVTKVGKFLRKTSLDELPQIYNVFIGQMSFIGYRPLVPSEEKCNLMREKLGVFEMKPGLSGYSQIHGRDDVYYKNKALMDAYYVKNSSLLMDIKIVFLSIKVVFKKDGNRDAH